MKIQYDNILNESLSIEEKMDKIYEHGWNSDFNEYIQYQGYQMPENVNDSIDLLITMFTDKNSKKLIYAGKYLKKAFLEAPPVEQRKIGLAFLTGNKADTEWVCKNLGDFSLSYKVDSIVRWHPCYEEAIEHCWEKYHGDNCGKIIIQFFDEEKIRSRIDEFQSDNLYFWLCRRFVKEDWFKVNAKYLKRCFVSINSYLYIMSQTTEGITNDEAEELLYKWIGAVATLYMNNRIEDVFIPAFYLNDPHHVIKAWGIDNAIFCLLKMGKEDVVGRFISWGNLVREEFERIFHNLHGAESSKDAAMKFCLTILNNFPSKYEYLTRLNLSEYKFIVGKSQPLAEPVPRYRDYIWSAYLSTEEYRHHTYRKEYYRLLSKDEEYKLLIENNSSMQKLIDKLGLNVCDKDLSDVPNYDSYEDSPF